MDAGALIALADDEERPQALVDAALAAGARVTVPAVVVAEWWRGQHGPDPTAAFVIEATTDELARKAGIAAGNVDGATAIDAIVMASAAERGDTVLTSDFHDLERLRAHFREVTVLSVQAPKKSRKTAKTRRR